MTRPSFSEWKTNSTATPDGLVAQTRRERILWALAAWASQKNPDNTAL